MFVFPHDYQVKIISPTNDFKWLIKGAYCYRIYIICYNVAVSIMETIKKLLQTCSVEERKSNFCICKYVCN